LHRFFCKRLMGGSEKKVYFSEGELFFLLAGPLMGDRHVNCVIATSTKNFLISSSLISSPIYSTFSL